MTGKGGGGREGVCFSYHLCAGVHVSIHGLQGELILLNRANLWLNLSWKKKEQEWKDRGIHDEGGIEPESVLVETTVWNPQAPASSAIPSLPSPRVVPLFTKRQRRTT